MRERSDAQQGGRPLGWVSIALGVPTALLPGRVCRLIGVRDRPVTRRVLRAVGVQECVAGAGLLRDRRPGRWLWSRVAGDAGHLVLLGVASTARGSRPGRLALTAATVVGAGIADVVTARRSAGAAAGSTDATVQAKAAVTINRPPEEVYRRWRDLERLPEFAYHVESVRETGEGRSHWVARAPGGRTVEWDAEVVKEAPGELIAWRSLEGADVPNSGTVRFAAAPGGRGTEVTVELRYTPRGGKAAVALARLLGEDASQQVADDLRRFKQVVETGEVVRSDGSPEGSVTGRLLRQRPAQPSA